MDRPQSTQASPDQLPGEVEANPIGIDTRTAQAVSDHLNADMSNLYVAYHQLKKHHWLVEGPQFRDLHLLLDELAEHALDAADDLAERITNLGGIPVGAPGQQEDAASVTPEPEGRFDLRTMFENDLHLLQGTVSHLRETAEIAHDRGDYGSVHVVQKHLYRQEDSVQRLSHVLADIRL